MITRDVLRRCVLFSELTDTELDAVTGSVLEKQYDAGATIFNEGDPAEEILVVQEGRVALQITLPRMEGQINRRITVDVIGKDDVVGWSAIVEPYKYTLTAICLQKVSALSISGNKLRWLLRDNPKVGYEVTKGLIKVVVSRLDETRQVLVSERLLSPKVQQ